MDKLKKSEFFYKKQKVKLVKDLNVEDVHGKWVQIEFLNGENKGMKMPVTTIELIK